MSLFEILTFSNIVAFALGWICRSLYPLIKKFRKSLEKKDG